MASACWTIRAQAHNDHLAESVAFLQHQAEHAPARPATTNFYLSRAWRELRYKALKLHGGAVSAAASARHPATRFMSIISNHAASSPNSPCALDNLQVLCDDCNLGKSNKDQTDWRPVAVIEASPKEAS